VDSQWIESELPVTCPVPLFCAKSTPLATDGATQKQGVHTRLLPMGSKEKRPGKAAFYAGAGNFSAALSQGKEERICFFRAQMRKNVLLFDRPCV